MAVPGQIQLTVVRMNDRVPLPRASESNGMRFSAAQGRESNNGQCLNPGHNDGCHRLYKAARLGWEHLPSFVLTVAETLAIRSHPPRCDHRPGPAGRRNRGPAMITLTVWHNVVTDAQDRHAGMLDGYQPGNPMVRVFAYQAGPAGRSRRRSPKRRSPSATATPAAPAGRTCPAGITSASCGRCRSPETGGVPAGRVVLAALSCGSDRRRGARPGALPASVSPAQGGRTDE